jgi:hypothetical protein
MPARDTDLEKKIGTNKILIADIGVEGGGTTIYGRHSEGVWTFWTEGTSMDLDENDDEVWRSWSSEPSSSLDLLVPEDWTMNYPMEIHPDFLGWFRANYEKARGTKHAARRSASIPG